MEHRIAELWFRNADDEIKSKLKVQTLIDLVSKVAGLPNLLLIIFGIMLGSFQNFYSNLEMYMDIQKADDDEESEQEETGDTPDDDMICKKSGLCTKLKIFLLHNAEFLYKCCCPFIKKD